MNDNSSTVEVCRVASDSEARDIASALQEAGIVVRVSTDPDSGSGIRVPATQAASARQLLERRDATASVFRVTSWTCPKCGEEVESEIGTCWNCLYCPAAC